MNNNKNNKIEDTGEDEGVIKINVEDSSLLEFTKRNLPSENQVKVFEEYVKTESKEDEIEESLNEIYQDDNGGAIDVSRMDVSKKKGFFFWLFGFIFFILIGMFVFSYVYNNIYLNSYDGKSDIEFTVEGKNEVVSGEEFVYTINYKNLSNVDIKDVSIEVKFPDNFIFLDSEPTLSEDNKNLWTFSSIAPQHVGKIKIKGKIINFKGKTDVLLAYMNYTPVNFSSEFRKDASIATVVKDLGMDINFDFVKTVLVGEDNTINIKLKKLNSSYLNNFKISVDPQENIKVSENKQEGEEFVVYEEVRPGTWQVNEFFADEKILPIKFKISEKLTDEQSLIFNFYKEGDDGKLYKFHDQKLDFTIVKSDLNLTLIVNGERTDQGAEFGQKLNYSIVYSNKGETAISDVVLIAVLESDFLDWDTLVDKNEGKEKGNTIAWTKEQIPGLELLESKDEGIIDFSINISELGEITEGAEYQINSYVQYSVGGEGKTGEDSQSNSVVVKINSNLQLDEQLRYFSEDNIPVGSGPNPPKVGEDTSYKVYWNLTNSLHELNNLIIKTKLPDYVFWGAYDSVSAGVIQFNEQTREVVWDIGRLPVSVHEAQAEFNITVKPQEEDKNKIMILLTGSTVEAKDAETGDVLTQSTKAKTTKLEDDEIGEGDGIVN